MTVAEGGGVKAVKKKFSDVYLPALKANWVLWPAVQLINFRFMPLQFQIVSLFVGERERGLASFFANFWMIAFCFGCRYRVDCLSIAYECF